MSDELKMISVPLAGPRPGRPGGTCTIGHYKVVGDEVVMCKPDGAEVVFDGKKYRKRFGTKSGEQSEREVAAELTKDIKSALKHEWDERPNGFSGPITYPKFNLA
jgi:hypothetical protein